MRTVIGRNPIAVTLGAFCRYHCSHPAYWYAPAVRALVKKMVQSAGMPIFTTELVEFQLQP